MFNKYGVEKFDPINEQFDPHRHHAVFQIPDGSKKADTIAAVLKVIIIYYRFCLNLLNLFKQLITIDSISNYLNN